MKRKREKAREFGGHGQLSLRRSFRAASSFRQTDSKDVEIKLPSKSRISLSEFLNRKLSKPFDKSVQEKQSSFLTIAGGSKHPEAAKNVPPENFVLSATDFRNFRNVAKDICQAGSTGGDDPGKCQIVGSEQRNNPFAVSTSTGGNQITTAKKRLVVLGEDPKPRHRTGPSFHKKRQKDTFNHYANGRGWWGCDMEGVDSEEVGCNDGCEGVGTTTVGRQEWH